MTISEAVHKNKLKVGDIIEHTHNKKALRVKRIVPNDSSNFGVVCHYVNRQEHEEMLKRGYTCVKLMCYDDYRPIEKG